MRILDSISDMLKSRSTVQMVANDPQLSAEILLLVRVMFADGELSPVELELFKEICEAEFSIPADDVPDVLQFLRDFGYETSGEQAAEMFADMDDERRRVLMVHVLKMARIDAILHTDEIDLIARVAKVLGYSPEQIRRWIG